MALKILVHSEGQCLDHIDRSIELCYTILYHLISYHIISYHIISYYITLYCISLYYMFYYITCTVMYLYIYIYTDVPSSWIRWWVPATSPRKVEAKFPDVPWTEASHGDVENGPFIGLPTTTTTTTTTTATTSNLYVFHSYLYEHAGRTCSNSWAHGVNYIFHEVSWNAGYTPSYHPWKKPTFFASLPPFLEPDSQWDWSRPISNVLGIKLSAKKCSPSMGWLELPWKFMASPIHGSYDVLCNRSISMIIYIYTYIYIYIVYILFICFLSKLSICMAKNGAHPPVRETPLAARQGWWVLCGHGERWPWKGKVPHWAPWSMGKYT